MDTILKSVFSLKSTFYLTYYYNSSYEAINEMYTYEIVICVSL